MSANRKSNSNFLVQGSILAVASILSRIIGLLYRVPLTAIIGNVGNDYYSCAYEIYSMMLLISSYSLPLAVSKMVSSRMALGQKKNAHKVFKGALAIALTTGTAGCVIVSVSYTHLDVYKRQLLHWKACSLRRKNSVLSWHKKARISAVFAIPDLS